MDQKAEQRARALSQYRETIGAITGLISERSELAIEEMENYREPLSRVERTEITLQLSWGGPSDGFKFYQDAEGLVTEGYYFFADWFTYDEFQLTESELENVLTVYPIE